MQTLGSRQTVASSTSQLLTRKAQPFHSSVQTRVQCQVKHSFLSGKSPLARRQIYLSRALSGGAETLDQRKQEAREWINAWKSNGSSGSAAEGNGSAEVLDLDEEDDDDDFDDEFGGDDGEYEEDDSEGQDPDFEEGPLSEGPFKYNIPNSDKGGKFSPDYTLSDGSVIYTSDTLAAVKKN